METCKNCGEEVDKLSDEGRCFVCQEQVEYDKEHLVECKGCGNDVYDDEVDGNGLCEQCQEEAEEEEEEEEDED